MIQKHIPQKLPRSFYPKATDLKQHGLYPLPDSLPSTNWQNIKKYRSKDYRTTSLELLSKTQILQMAHMVARSFAKNEPMKRHLKPPRIIPKTIVNAIHQDPFGKESFGELTAEDLLYWFIRLFILTNPTDEIDHISINSEMPKFSVAILNKDSEIIGGAFNLIASPHEEILRKSDPFIDAVLFCDQPILNLIFAQEHDALEALKKKFPDFQKALQQKEVGLHFMVARSPELPTEHTFELVAASAETFKNHGFKYMVTCASNQWTGAACEVLNGTKVHFFPYRAKQAVAKKEGASLSEPYSEDGFISDKDSGAMFYVVKL